MKKTLSIILSLILALTALTALPFAALAMDGEGTAENPYKIGTAAELKEFRDLVNGGQDGICAVLTANIDLNNEEWTPIGIDYTSSYSGTFDGQNYSIKGLNVNGEYNYAGLFGRISGTVQNINVSGSVTSTTENGIFLGGIVGNLNGAVKNCSFHGATSAHNTNIYNGCFAGGIAGRISSPAIIENCAHYDGDVSAIGDGTGCHAGGVVGIIYDGTTVENCAHYGGSISAKDTQNNNKYSHAGGVVGVSDSGTVKNCLSIVDEITASGSNGYTYIGGVIGENQSTVTGCYYLDGTAAQSVGLEKGTTKDCGALTAEQFKDAGYFENWDFNNVWYMGADAPQLIDIKTPVGTWTDLKTALQTSGSYVLTADVVPSNAYWDDALSVPSGKSVVLDLNGHIVDRGYREDSTQLWDGSVIKISGNFTVIDSNPNATHETPVTYTDPITGRELTVNGGIITGGFADQYGGGVQVQGGTFHLKGGSIVNNIAGKNGFGAVEGLGGGVLIQSGLFDMTGGAILGNKASNKNTMMPDTPLGKGGAVYIANGTFSFTGGLIRGNVAGADLGAGGIYVGENGTFSMTGGTLVGNYSPHCDNVNCDEGTSTELITLTMYSNDGNDYAVRQTFVKDSTAPLATDIFVRDGYDFLGWNVYADGTGATYADGADITATQTNLSSGLNAQWEKDLFTGNASDLVHGDKFQMGMYPQTRVTDSETLTALAAIDCTMTSYGYLKDGGTVDMTYADIVYDGAAYRKVTITENRPDNTTGTSSNQPDNGYNAGETYYFKWEPIVWQVLAKEADGVYVMSKALLDSQAYHNVYEDTTWENCTLRTWLNDGFYNAAFSEGEKDKIVSCTHENEDHPSYNTEGGNNTTDNLWVLSRSDAINTNYGFSSDATNYDEARRAQGTDYAKSQGIWVSTSSSYLGNSGWWLRTPGRYSYRACLVYYNGYSVYNDNVYYTNLGIRPAFKLDLNATVSTSDSAICRVLGHDWGTPTYSWTKEGNAWKCTAERVCTRDTSHKETETVTAASAVSQAATCTAQGKTKYTATFTNSAFEQQEKTETDIAVDTSAHDYGEPNYNWTQENGVWKCTAERVCSRNADHKETETVEGAGAEKTPATCTEVGTTTYTATFTNAAFEQQTKDVDDIPALTHDYGEPTYNWTQENGIWKCTAERVCSRNTDHKETEAVEGVGAEKAPATCTELGTTTYTATFTNAAFEQQTKDVDDIPALTHDYGEPTYNWTQENGIWKCTAERVCSRNADHKETETVDGVGAEKTPATCTEVGTTTYTATFTNPVFEQQTKDALDIDALGHTYGTTGDERFTCTRCGYVDEEKKTAAEAEDKAAADEAAAKAKAEKEEAKAEFVAGVKGTSDENKVTVKWGKVKGAQRYVIYATYCGKKNKYKKIATVKGDITKYDITKLNGKKLNPKKNVKVYVVAQKKVKGKYKKIFKTPTFHIAGAKSKYTNVKKVKVKKSSYSLKAGKTAKIKATLVLENKNKKAIKHVRKYRYRSSNTAVATVDKNGKIKAKGKGTCTVYVYSNNGMAKAIKVKVK